VKIRFAHRILLLLTLFGFRASISAASQPNILFILTEDQGAQIGAFGTPGILTPHMDALANSGGFFRRAYVAYPVCSPSKAAIYTALHNHSNGLLNNTVNYHKPASQLTAAEKTNSLYLGNRIGTQSPTLIERLQEAGYYQGVTHKLHVAPSERFPYDEFIAHSTGEAAAGFIRRAKEAGKPWHLFFNIPNSHRPFPNSDKIKIRVQTAEVKLPAFMPETPVIRKDWAEYLAAIEAADHLVGEALAALRESGQEQNTVVVFMGDHGPCFVHGKMNLYDLGLHVPMIIRAPGMKPGLVSDAAASELDLMPTLLDLLGLAPQSPTHGVSLRPILDGKADAQPRKYAFAEISHLGQLPNDGMQERSVCDGRWHLIYRARTETKWRTVQADNKLWKPWGNRSYRETVRVKAAFPEAFRRLAEMDPQNLGGQVPPMELFDLQSDPDELNNLAAEPAHREPLERLFDALRQWSADTQDTSTPLPLKP
jgi:N-sulfoglucosamine sulfohydrolase